jgi:hypothetical protein
VMSKRKQKLTREEHLSLAPIVVALKVGLQNISTIILANKRRKSDLASTERSCEKSRAALLSLCVPLHGQWFDLGEREGYIYDNYLGDNPYGFDAAVAELLGNRHRTMVPSEYARWLRENLADEIGRRINGHVPAATLDLYIKLERRLSALRGNLAFDEPQWSLEGNPMIEASRG